MPSPFSPTMGARVGQLATKAETLHDEAEVVIRLAENQLEQVDDENAVVLRRKLGDYREATARLHRTVNEARAAAIALDSGGGLL